MEYFWAVVVSAILLMVVWSTISSKIKRRRIREATEKIFPKVPEHIRADHRYNIFVSNGKMFQDVRFIGISPAHDSSNPYLPFPLCEWLVVEKKNGKRAYLKPESIRYYEDSDDEATVQSAPLSRG